MPPAAMENAALTDRAVATVLREILRGTSPEYGLLLNRGDAGLLRSLDALTAEQASRVPAGHEASVAAHVRHVSYGLGLLVRWSRGEEPFATADWAAAWHPTTVDDAEWVRLRDEFRTNADGFERALDTLLAGDEVHRTGTVGGVAHLAYHLGAIRQIERAARGPAATDGASG